MTKEEEIYQNMWNHYEETSKSEGYTPVENGPIQLVFKSLAKELAKHIQGKHDF